MKLVTKRDLIIKFAILVGASTLLYALAQSLVGPEHQLTIGGLHGGAVGATGGYLFARWKLNNRKASKQG